MSNYTQNTFFANKDNLATGNPSKVIYGSEIDAEFDEISTAIASKTEGDIPSGTKMLFMESAAPSGWTLETTWNDRVITVTSTAAQGGGTGGNWALSLSGTATLPNHSHGSGNLAGNHNTSSSIDGQFLEAGGVTVHDDSSISVNTGNTANPNSLPNISVTFGGNFANTVVPGNWRPAYARAIVCSKD